MKKKANIRNRYNQVPHLSRDTIRESDKTTRKHHIQESQEVSPFPEGDQKATRYRQDRHWRAIKEECKVLDCDCVEYATILML